jgi:hypothetical protein
VTRRLQHVSLCDECRYDGGIHYTNDLIPRAYRCPEYVKALCGVCGGTGWDTTDPLDPRVCSHAATKEAVERGDRARFCPSCDEGNGHSPCRCPS